MADNFKDVSKNYHYIFHLGSIFTLCRRVLVYFLIFYLHQRIRSIFETQHLSMDKYILFCVVVLRDSTLSIRIIRPYKYTFPSNSHNIILILAAARQLQIILRGFYFCNKWDNIICSAFVKYCSVHAVCGRIWYNHCKYIILKTKRTG